MNKKKKTCGKIAKIGRRTQQPRDIQIYWGMIPDSLAIVEYWYRSLNATDEVYKAEVVNIPSVVFEGQAKSWYNFSPDNARLSYEEQENSMYVTIR